MTVDAVQILGGIFNHTVNNATGIFGGTGWLNFTWGLLNST